jgi:aspartyl protease family protein
MSALRHYCRFAAWAALALATAAHAQTVGLSGMLGGKALLIVDGSPPKTVAAGDTYKGVKVVSTQGDEAVVEVSGKRHTMRVGDAPASVGGGGGGDAGGSRIVLTAGSGGHFFSQGQINGSSVQLMVDTGATSVAMSFNDAKRIGLDFQKGPVRGISTANGVIPSWQVKFASVRVGDVTVYDVDGVVTYGSMPYVLLGNSFLARFQMTRTNDQMVLEKRF